MGVVYVCGCECIQLYNILCHVFMCVGCMCCVVCDILSVCVCVVYVMCGYVVSVHCVSVMFVNCVLLYVLRCYVNCVHVMLALHMCGLGCCML